MGFDWGFAVLTGKSPVLVLQQHPKETVSLWDCSGENIFSQYCVLCEDTAGLAQWLERQTCDQKVLGSSPSRSHGKNLFSRVNFLCWLLFWYPLHPHVTAIAYIRSRPFCQKCRWQVTAKHTYTLPMWLWKKWHRKLVHGWMVYTELALRWQQFHVAPTMQQPKSAISTPLQWILKMCTIKGYSHSYRITWDTCTVNLLESRE